MLLQSCVAKLYYGICTAHCDWEQRTAGILRFQSSRSVEKLVGSGPDWPDRCHEIDHPPMPGHPPSLTAQSSASYCVNRVRYVSRQFMQNYGDSSAEVYDWFTCKTDRIQICREGQVLLVFCDLNRRKVLISLMKILLHNFVTWFVWFVPAKLL